MWSARNQPSAVRPGSRSPSTGESGARWRAMSPSAIDGPSGRSRWTYDTVGDVELFRLPPAAAQPPSPAPWRESSAPLHGSRRRSSPRRARHARRCRIGCGRSARARRAPGGSRRRAYRRRSAPSQSRTLARRDEPPVTSSTAPVVSMVMRVPSIGPSPPFSTNTAIPAPTSSPACAPPPQFGLQRIPADLRERLVEQTARSRRNRTRPRCRAR